VSLQRFRHSVMHWLPSARHAA